MATGEVRPQIAMLREFLAQNAPEGSGSERCFVDA